MKRTAWLLALTLLLGLALCGVTGCGGGETASDDTTASATDAATTEAPETACTTHTYVTTTTEATCTVDGNMVNVCSVCGDTQTETIPAKGHDYEVTTTAATMTENGEIRSVCKTCGDTKVESIPAMGEDGVVVDTITENVIAKEGGFVYLDAQSSLIALGGIAAPSDNSGEYYRFVASNKGAYPEDIQREGGTTAGGTLRFRISGGSFRIKAVRRTDLDYVTRDSYDFDIYLGTGTHRVLWQTLTTDFNTAVYESETLVLPEGVQEVMICLPRTVGFTSLQIAVEEGAYIAEPLDRQGGKIGFYGSSITQGYSASSPSLSYAMQLCLALDADCVNFGLSGSARGEKAVIDDICDKIRGAGLTAFILDYDWNINSSTELREGSTYWNGYSYQVIYEKLREALGPDVPIIMLSRPYFGKGTAGITGAEVIRCIQVIEGVCKKAIEAGDSNVAFISGKTFFPEEEQGACHVGDQVHPSDLGHSYMMAAVKPVLEQLLANS